MYYTKEQYKASIEIYNNLETVMEILYKDYNYLWARIIYLDFPTSIIKQYWDGTTWKII